MRDVNDERCACPCLANREGSHPWVIADPCACPARAHKVKVQYPGRELSRRGALAPVPSVRPPGRTRGTRVPSVKRFTRTGTAGGGRPDQKATLPFHYAVYLTQVGCIRAAAASVETVFSGAGKFMRGAQSSGAKL